MRPKKIRNAEQEAHYQAKKAQYERMGWIIADFTRRPPPITPPPTNGKKP